MGGLTPWWGDNHYLLVGKVINLSAGEEKSLEYVYENVAFLPLYQQENKRLYIPTNTWLQLSGWMPGVVK